MSADLISFRFNLGFAFINVLIFTAVLIISGFVAWPFLLAASVNASLSTYHRAKMLRTPKHPAIEPKDDGILCSLWDIRHTQKKMVDAGIIKSIDMSVCYDKACEECQNTRRDIRSRSYRRRQMLLNERAKNGQAQNMPEAQNNPRTHFRSEGTRTRPNGVPLHAIQDVTYRHGGEVVVVTWTWKKFDGEDLCHTQRFSRETFENMVASSKPRTSLSNELVIHSTGDTKPIKTGRGVHLDVGEFII